MNPTRTPPVIASGRLPIVGKVESDTVLLPPLHCEPDLQADGGALYACCRGSRLTAAVLAHASRGLRIYED